jgi:hypothetical protein
MPEVWLADWVADWLAYIPLVSPAAVAPDPQADTARTAAASPAAATTQCFLIIVLPSPMSCYLLRMGLASGRVMTTM